MSTRHTSVCAASTQFSKNRWFSPMSKHTVESLGAKQLTCARSHQNKQASYSGGWRRQAPSHYRARSAAPTTQPPGDVDPPMSVLFGRQRRPARSNSLRHCHSAAGATPPAMRTHGRSRGGGGIRTPEALTPGRFQGGFLRPLGHASAAESRAVVRSSPIGELPARSVGCGLAVTRRHSRRAKERPQRNRRGSITVSTARSSGPAFTK